ncbi:hypothetical protein F1559_003935 [Cyanidiococcus yangmingshanensis]|uniref:Uncharacterized protein n=1 Tax=Cyanidiococcus yangmingshanensis TaxID=2690220 RepID=A0A7J7II00_9RHOD|nr:hypothetical protein F1559_003935 [Cyanidiococcus yangmingshanensis]
MQRAHSVPSQLTLLSVLQRDAAAAENLRISKSTLLHVQNQQQRQRMALQGNHTSAYGSSSQAPPPAASSTLVAALEEAAAKSENGGAVALSTTARTAGSSQRNKADRGAAGERTANGTSRLKENGRTDHRVGGRGRTARQHEPQAGSRPTVAQPGLGGDFRLRRSATTGALDVIREASLDEELEELDDITLREHWKRLDAWGITSSTSSANSSPRSSPAISPAEMPHECGWIETNGPRSACSAEHLQRRSFSRKDAMDILAEQLRAEQVRRDRDTERQRLLEVARSHQSRASSQRLREGGPNENANVASAPMMGLPWPDDSFHLQGHDHVMQPPEMWRVQAHGFLIGHQMHTNEHGGWWVERWGQRRVNPNGPLTGDERNDYVRFGDKFGIDPDGGRWSEWWLELPERPGVARGHKWGRKTNGSEWNDEWER